jgi:hypothetical protein
MFDKERIARMKKGVIIVNNARGAIMDTQAVADACATGHIAGMYWLLCPAHFQLVVIVGLWQDIEKRHAHQTDVSNCCMSDDQDTAAMCGTLSLRPRTTRGATCPTTP